MKKQREKKEKKNGKNGKKGEQTQEVILDLDNSEHTDSFKKGVLSLKDLIAPPSIDRSNEGYLKVGKKYVRNYIVNGFPKHISVGWLDNIINNNEDVDAVIHIEPADERTALDELTSKITQFESQYSIEMEKGNNKNSTRLQNKIEELYSQREKVEQNYINLFYIQIALNLFMNTKEGLEKQSQLMENELKGRKIKLMQTFLQQDDGYKTALPLGKSYLPGMYRNFSSDALTACFPFYNAEISHKTGVYAGVNLATATPIYIDFYDRKILQNSNLSIFGQAGSGKTFLVSLLTMRSALKGIRTVIVDAESEYGKLCRNLGGSVILIAPGSTQSINPFDIEEEDVTDEEGLPTGVKEVKVKDKVADLLNLVGVMSGGLGNEQLSMVSYILNDLYVDKGINENPESLYDENAFFNEEKQMIMQGGVKKRMPQFTDFHNKLVERAKEEKSDILTSLANSLSMFKEGGVYDLFDCQTSEELKNFKDAPIVSFDVSKLEESCLRPIGMYIALSWTWEKFIKKNPLIKKRIVIDECWMLLSKNLKGYQFTSQFLENTARRIRKRNGGLLVASQSFHEFADNPQGKAVLSNSSVNIILKQDASDLDSVQETFKLSDGEKNFLYAAQRGEFLLKMKGESTVGFASAFDFERELIEKSYVFKD